MHDNRFLCPECRTDLKVKDNLIFIGENQKQERGIILFCPELGNYQLLHSENFSFEKGEHVNFYCPVCQADLSLSKAKKGLASVILITDNKIEYRIVFSKIAGKQMTIQIKDNEIVEFYGDDNPEEFLKD